MTLDATTIAILLALAAVASFVGSEVLRLAIRRFWSKTVDTAYVTVQDCRRCRDECSARRDGKNEDLFKLIRALRDEIASQAAEIRALRMQVVKFMIRTKADPKDIEEALAEVNG